MTLADEDQMTSPYEIYKAARVEMEVGHYEKAIELFRLSVAQEPHFKGGSGVSPEK